MPDKVIHLSFVRKVTPSGRSHHRTPHKVQKSHEFEVKSHRKSLHVSHMSLYYNFALKFLPRIYQCLRVISYQKIPGNDRREQICTFRKMAKSQPEVQPQSPNLVHILHWGWRVQIWSQISLLVKPEIVDFLTSGGNISKFLGGNRKFFLVKKLSTFNALQSHSLKLPLKNHSFPHNQFPPTLRKSKVPPQKSRKSPKTFSNDSPDQSQGFWSPVPTC